MKYKCENSLSKSMIICKDIIETKECKEYKKAYSSFCDNQVFLYKYCARTCGGCYQEMPIKSTTVNSKATMTTKVQTTTTLEQPTTTTIKVQTTTTLEPTTTVKEQPTTTIKEQTTTTLEP